jgi:hypothetical protein
MTRVDFMKADANRESDAATLTTELLILADGRILAHNVTPAFAALLNTLNPGDEQIAPRTAPRAPAHQISPSHELPH